MQICSRLTVCGRVQGVGYRWFIQQQATRLGLLGFVRNMPEGEVEIEVSGPPEKVEALVMEARKGPKFSDVTAVVRESTESDDAFDSFEIRL